MDYMKESLKKHYEWKGKLEVVSRAKVENKEDLSLAYTPGVAQACLEIQKDIDKNGLRIKVMTGNGFKSEKPNESVQNILKVNGQQLKILQDLDLKTPSQTPKVGDGDDLL